MSKDDPLSVMNPEARGGDIAEGGFRAQDHLTLARIPGWLAQDGFDSMIREAHGDAEAAFHVPGTGITREFVEYKDYEIQPAGLRDEIARFQRMAEGTGVAYRRFVLSTRGLSPTLRPVHAALDRVRGALPFYADVPAIADASYADYEAAAAKVGLDAVAARFVFDRVVLEPDAPAAETLAAVLFDEAMRRAFPASADASGRQMTAAREALAALIVSSKALPIARGAILDALASGLPELADELRAAPVRLHTSIDPSEARTPGPIRMEWDNLFGGEARRYPPSAEWDRQVVGEMAALRDWMVASGRPRSVVLSGHRRLSASVAVGRSLSAVAGFRVTMDYRGEAWRTDSYPPERERPYPWHEEYHPGEVPGGELAVGIGIINDVRPEVISHLDRYRKGTARLFLYSAIPLASDAHANGAVSLAKTAIQRGLQRAGARRLALFLAVPAHFALFLGHRLNATAPVTCHERGSDGYVATCSC
ncbi:MAG: SAVED domain-containing protein [Acetobacteraceae bacterium]|nr:SAVED domain-containing protein [Acetobacteraceae bacterium]